MRRKTTYRINREQFGSWEYRDGDIIGIDRRTWISSGPDQFSVVRLNSAGIPIRNYPRIFKSVYAATKFIRSKGGRVTKHWDV